MKRQTQKIKIFTPSVLIPACLATGLLLAGCTGTPDYVACPKISAPEVGTSAFMKMDETGEIIDVRLNGVRGLCEAEDNGAIEMTVSVGLKLKRAAADELEAGVAEVQMVTFVVDPDDKVVANDTIRYKTGFAKGQRIHYPAAEYKITVAEGNRLVLSLIPAL